MGSDKTVVPAFHTAVLSAELEENGVALSGVEGTELILVPIVACVIYSSF